MEMEILNEIMTSTVASLFTINRTSHLKFFKNSSQLNESKNDIPIGRASNTNLLLNTNGNLNESSVSTNPGDWVSQEGKKFQEDAIVRLKIDTRRFLYMEQEIGKLSIEELNKIKKNVKNELKRYDQTFVSKFYRQPAKHDKEPLRPLYMYYKKLKQLLDKKQKAAA
jgi:hypothetical protein